MGGWEVKLLITTSHKHRLGLGHVILRCFLEPTLYTLVYLDFCERQAFFSNCCQFDGWTQGCTSIFIRARARAHCPAEVIFVPVKTVSHQVRKGSVRFPAAGCCAASGSIILVSITVPRIIPTSSKQRATARVSTIRQWVQACVADSLAQNRRPFHAGDQALPALPRIRPPS